MVLAVIRASDGAAFTLSAHDLHNINSCVPLP